MSISVTVDVRAEVDPDEAYRRLVDFEQYPRLTSSVRGVDVDRSDGPDTLTSSWAVDFRGGILQWTERDTLDRPRRVLTFEQVVGDLDHFAGSWRITAADGGCAVRFDAELDMGIPSLAAIIDPIADAALRDNVLQILSGLLGALRSPAGDPVAPSAARSMSGVGRG